MRQNFFRNIGFWSLVSPWGPPRNVYYILFTPQLQAIRPLCLMLLLSFVFYILAFAIERAS
jgi:hypothetical protein